MGSSETTDLTPEEIALCGEIGFDEPIVSLVKSRSLGEIARLIRCTEESEEQPAEGISVQVDEDDAYRVIDELWDALEETGYIAFYDERNFGDAPDRIGLIRSEDEFDILRVKQTNGWNCDIGTDDIIARIQEWGARYPMRIVGADSDWVEILLGSDLPNAEEFAQEIYEFCPNVVDQETETVEALAESIKESSIIFLWWD